MRGGMPSVRIVGRCWACGNPVRAADAVRIEDHSVRLANGRLHRKLVHRFPDCYTIARMKLDFHGIEEGNEMAKGKGTAERPEELNPEEWETIQEPFPDTWDFEENAIMVGKLLAVRTQEMDGFDGEKRDAKLYDFETEAGKFSVWGSYQIDVSIDDSMIGNTFRIDYLGTRAFTGDTGPQNVKDFRVARKR